jgi:hypothetical protein
VAPRSNWKGYLKLSLVSASIAIYPATSSGEKVRFNTLNRQTGNRLKRQMVDSVTGEVVESEEEMKRCDAMMRAVEMARTGKFSNWWVIAAPAHSARHAAHPFR